jgi:predicted SAM-dependent methyltransferase/ADP-heptose:LPS heptosyltransferase
MTWTLATSQGRESAKIRWSAMPYVQGVGLDIGCGEEKVFPHAIGLDEVPGTNLCQDASDLAMVATGSLDFVYSSHLLEHIQDHEAALKEWWRVVKVGGHLVLYLPHKHFYPNCGEPGANPDHKHDFLPADIIGAMSQVRGSWQLVESQERQADHEYSFFLVFHKLSLEGTHHRWSLPEKPQKTAVVWRCGAYGDMLQAASICAGLKQEGYHVTLYTRAPFSEVVAHDPHIDRLINLNTYLLPDGMLGTFPTEWAMPCWDHLKDSCDRFVNLAYAMEAWSLILPTQPARHWPHAVRHAQCNGNYLEFQEQIAGLPHAPRVKFYPTEEESTWAKSQRIMLGPDPVLLWAVKGTGVNKYWPFIAPLIHWIRTTYPTMHIVLTGSPTDLTEVLPWDGQPFVTVAKTWTMRQAMAMAQRADLVMGPETGLLHAVCQEPMPKIVLLSHSTEENLTRDWVNTTALSSTETPCYPCHMLHDTWNDCARPTKVEFIDYLVKEYPQMQRENLAPSEEGLWNVAECQFRLNLQTVSAAIAAACSTVRV